MLWRPAAGGALTGTPNKFVRSGDPRDDRTAGATLGAAGSGMTPRRVLFVTGKLAEPALRRVLADMAPPFAYDVAVLGSRWRR